MEIVHIYQVSPDTYQAVCISDAAMPIPGASCCPPGGHQAQPAQSQGQAHKIIQTYYFGGGDRPDEGGASLLYHIYKH